MAYPICAQRWSKARFILFQQGVTHYVTYTSILYLTKRAEGMLAASSFILNSLGC